MRHLRHLNGPYPWEDVEGEKWASYSRCWGMAELKQCPLCKKLTHPQNFLYSPGGEVVGCNDCKGKPQPPKNEVKT